MEWDPIPEGSENGVLKGYKIQYRAEDAVESAVDETAHDELSAVLSKLSYDTLYTISVAAFTSVGPGNESRPIQARTKMCKYKLISPHFLIFMFVNKWYPC